jgi:hypothetical protein
VSSIYRLRISDPNLFTLAVNSHASAAEAQVEAFAHECGLYLPQLSQVNTMAGFMYPTANLERLTLIGKMMFLLFYIDDRYGDLGAAQGLEPPDPAVVNRIQLCIWAFRTRQALTNDPLAVAFARLRLEMDAYADPSWMDRFNVSLGNHLICAMRPSTFGWNLARQTLKSYLIIREHVSGMFPAVDLIEFAIGKCLPVSLVADPHVKALVLACVRIGALSNDIFSYPKEVLDGGLRLNLVEVLRTVNRVTPTEALDRAFDLVNGFVDEFFKLCTAPFIWDEEAQLSREMYIEAIKHQISATWHWEMNTNRYRSAQSPFLELRTLLPLNCVAVL